MSTIDSDDDDDGDDNDDKNNSDNDKVYNYINNIKHNNDSNNNKTSLAPISIVAIFISAYFGLNLLPTGSVILVQRTNNEDLLPLLVTSPPGNGNARLETIVLSQSQLCPLFIKEE